MSAVLALLAAGCTGGPEAEGSGGPEEALAEFYQQDLVWEECGGDFECATYEVPLDYDDPDGERVEIAVKRLPAAGEAEARSS